MPERRPFTPLRGPDPRLPVTEARERLADLCAHVRDGTDTVVLTRHGRPVAALVGMAWLDRFKRVGWQDTDVETGWWPVGLRREGDHFLSVPEAAVRLRGVQLDRLAERRLLAEAGLEPIPGGEIEAPVEFVERVEPPAAEPAEPEAPSDAEPDGGDACEVGVLAKEVTRDAATGRIAGTVPDRSDPSRAAVADAGRVRGGCR